MVLIMIEFITSDQKCLKRRQADGGLNRRRSLLRIAYYREQKWNIVGEYNIVSALNNE